MPFGRAVFGSVRSATQWLSEVPTALPVVGGLLRPPAPRLWRTPGGVQVDVLTGDPGHPAD
ncbi:hypothetical protein, partial [Streptomyces shenzhenensis]|uniref:hypothetical protein n=1 Tax=Streptomyces shenzhenensis TaxID=943815 RepID=UPI001C68867E